MTRVVVGEGRGVEGGRGGSTNLLPRRMVVRLDPTTTLVTMAGSKCFPCKWTAVVGAAGITAGENLVYEGEDLVDLSRPFLPASSLSSRSVQAFQPVQGGDRLAERLLLIAGTCSRGCWGGRQPLGAISVSSKAARHGGGIS